MIYTASKGNKIALLLIILFSLIFSVFISSFNWMGTIFWFILNIFPFIPLFFVILRFELTIFPNRIEIQRTLYKEIYYLDQIIKLKRGRPRFGRKVKGFSWITLVLTGNREKTLALDLLSKNDRDLVINHIIKNIKQDLTYK